jgi:NAD(P)H-hydrate epimerase
LAQGLPVWDAARLGVYLHGAAGEAVRDRIGDAGLLASDLPEEVARARRRLTARDRGDVRPLGFTIGERRS